MTFVEPLQLSHSWPIFERGLHFDLGRVALPDETGARTTGPIDPSLGVGTWACDLADNRLSWSTEVYALFGLPRDVPAARAATVALYAEQSRAAMERLRAHAIRHRRGFTLDAEIHPLGGGRRWIRLIAASVGDGQAVTRLQGLKYDVSDEYS